ncbi:FCS-Like Zinc finger 8-like [Primulina tabacum]|uniref:FCS-Like Zinc finger 8-like n=1 Tax=Primulina tabacum TaxID=48773 RepID=UPI003F5A91F3
MLRNRSRIVTSKQALMAEQNSLPSTDTKKQTPSYLGSPRFFNGLLSKIISDSENIVDSPRSVLDPQKSPDFVRTILSEKNLSSTLSSLPEIISNGSGIILEPKAFGLALIDSINEQKTDEKISKPVTRMVLLAKPDVEIPSTKSPPESPDSLGDFGIKTREPMVFSPSSSTSVRKFSRQLSLKEMEMCEDYTRVISHGPNPKTTHIFDDCIVESCCGNDPELFDIKKMENDFQSSVLESESLDFLSAEQGKAD